MGAKIAFRPFYGTIDSGQEISKKLSSSFFALIGMRPLASEHTKAEDQIIKKYASLANQTIVEIGVAEGGSALSSRTSMSANACIYLIDPFLPGSIPLINFSSLVAHKYVGSVQNGSVFWIKDFSFNAIKKWDKNRSIDLLFIDGDHSESGCHKDWVDWSPYISIGGHVMFHDARIFPGGWPTEEDGSVKVVNALFRSKDRSQSWNIVEEIDSLVVVQRVS
jgi:hypothetical protein